jgi:phosphatidylserine decarboxylase
MDLLRYAPKGTFSRGIGWLARIRVPRPLRAPVYRGFAHAVGADLGELDRPLDAFERFDDFFTRPHAEGARPISAGKHDVVSPVDGSVSEWGVSDGGRMIQAKGIDYTVEGLLADRAEARRFSGGAYATFYLAPRNYHRIHSPVGGRIAGYRHIPGAFYPVNRLAVAHVPGLFAINERIVSYVDSDVGRVAVVKVAATGVGHISLSYAPQVTSHARGAVGRDGSARTFEHPIAVERGGELGRFHLGSTVIVLFEPGRVELALTSGAPVRLGETIGQLREIPAARAKRSARESA